MKPALVIAIGNTLRRDDGVAHHVSDLLNVHPDVETRAVLQLTPEMADGDGALRHGRLRRRRRIRQTNC